MRDEKGYASILVLGTTLIAIGVAGLAVDGTRAFLFRRSLQNAADAAALAGAAEVDRETLYSTGGTGVVIDPQSARARAGEWLARRRLAADAAVSAGDDLVRVVLKGRIDTSFLRVVGIGSLPVGVESVARPVPGDV